MLSPKFTWVARLQALAPWVIVPLFLLPVVVGLAGTWLPAFDYFPALGQTSPGLHSWHALFGYPGLSTSIKHTLITGIGSATLALAMTWLLLMGLYPSKFFRWVERALAPLLSIPHAAFAIGVGLLVVPSGSFFRLWHAITGSLPSPPFLASFQDPYGLSLLWVLAFKELPFLVLMSLAVLPSLRVEQTLQLTQSLGHSRRFAWLWLIGPQLYRQIRLPFYAVMAYGLTVVDVAQIAGPTTPGTLAVQVTDWFENPDLRQRTVGAAAATLLLILVLLAMLASRCIEILLRYIRPMRLALGRPESRHRGTALPLLAKTIVGATVILYGGAFVLTALWSVAGRWRYPDLLPAQLNWRSWQQNADQLWAFGGTTLSIALISSVTALVLVVLALENELRRRLVNKPVDGTRLLWLLYLPLLVPQVAFLFGFQVALIHLGLDAQYWTLVWAHLVFVLPYVFLTLSGPYRKFDERYRWVGLTLGARPSVVFWRVKILMLLRPLLVAFATGMAVSVAQYLPTLFIGAGHYATLTTEAVAAASGSNRRVLAVLALSQQIIPLIIYALAILVPAYVFRHRKALLND